MNLDHMVIMLSDLESQLGFYETLLPLIGFRQQSGHVFANEQGVALDFRQAQESDRPYRRRAPGLNHLGFTAPDRGAIEAVAERMAAADFSVPDIQEYPDGSALFLADADGMRLELSCYETPAVALTSAKEEQKSS